MTAAGDGTSTAFATTDQPHAVVLGLDDGLTGIQTARTLARRGIPVVALAGDRQHPYCRTNVCERIVPATAKDDSLVTELMALGPGFEQKPALIPCQDVNVGIVSRHRAELAQHYSVILPPAETIEILMDKDRFAGIAAEGGFNVPTTRLLTSRADAEAAAEAADYPSILKPSYRTPEWNRRSRIKAFLVEEARELLRLFDRWHPIAPTLLLQDWIPGPDTNNYTCNVYVGAKDQPVLSHVSRKLRQWPIGTGQGCSSRSSEDDEMRALTLRFFRSLDFQGLGYLEAKRSATSGEFVLIEPNVGRPTGRSAAAEAAGVELLASLYCDAVGAPRPPTADRDVAEVTWVFLRQDIRSALASVRRRELTVSQWRDSLRGERVYALWDRRDPKPFVHDLLRGTRRLVRR